LVSKYRATKFSPCKNDSFFIIVFSYFTFVLNDILSGVKTKYNERCSVKSYTSCIQSLLYLLYLLLSNRTKCAPTIFRPCVNNTIVFLLNPSFSNSIFVREQKQDTPKDAAWKTLQCGWIIKNKMREKRDPWMSCFPIPLRSLTPTNRSGFENKTCNY